MKVALVNDGPVTIALDSRDRKCDSFGLTATAADADATVDARASSS